MMFGWVYRIIYIHIYIWKFQSVKICEIDECKDKLWFRIPEKWKIQDEKSWTRWKEESLSTKAYKKKHLIAIFIGKYSFEYFVILKITSKACGPQWAQIMKWRMQGYKRILEQITSKARMKTKTEK